MILFETLYFLDLDIYSFPSLGNFSAIITSNNLSTILSLFLFGSLYENVSMLDVVCEFSYFKISFPLFVQLV